MFGRTHTAVKIPADYVILCTSASAYATDKVRKLLNAAKVAFKTKTVSSRTFPLIGWLSGMIHIQPSAPNIEFYVHKDELVRGREVLKAMEEPPAR